MAEYTKDELVAKLDHIITSNEATWQDLAMLVFHPCFPSQFFAGAVQDLEDALAEHKATTAHRQEQENL